MGETIRTVAILAANPALTSILTMVLAGNRALRVRSFEGINPLKVYMSLTPVDLVVCDFDAEEAPAADVAQALRGERGLARRDFRIIALSRIVNDTVRKATVGTGIDEVIVKPMSPRYLLERVLAHLRQPAPSAIVTPGYHGPERRNRLRRPEPVAFQPRNRAGDNVVSLFPQQ